ncbi:MAG: hypothetical protein GY803_23480, partial [Chloroflexi bacterium]|nr:hypothetical protein [Chloroflexota bacterium]
MRKGILFFIVFVLLLAGPTAVRYLRFYELNSAVRDAPSFYDPKKIDPVPTPASADFVDEPEMGDGLVLLDMAHQNNFTVEDIAYLDGRLSARGFELLPYEGGDLGLRLSAVNAFIVITPLSEFTIEETLAVARFVERGGRLLLVGDPARFNVIFDEENIFAEVIVETDPIPLNSLANEFDIAFNGDYLYNTVENEGNFRNIILRREGFAEDDLADGLQKLAFYGAHSLRVGTSGEALITANDDTWSSATDRPGDLVLAATSRDGQVLALGDIHFLIQPYFTVFDNGAFIARIADFLTEPTGRRFALGDFPYFYRNPAHLVYTGAPDLGPDAFDEIIALQDAFRRVDRDLALTAVPPKDADALYLGLYNQAEDVAEILTSSGISLTIDPPILPEAEMEEPDEPSLFDVEEDESDEETAVRLIQSDLGNVQMSGTSLILLDEEDGRRRVVVLAASAQGLENSVNRLLNLISLNADYALSDCLVQDNLALCPSNVFDEAVEAELISDETPDTPIEEETPFPPEDEGDLGGGDGPNIDLEGVVLQGPISAGETVTGTLAEGETHSWMFVEGPA